MEFSMLAAKLVAAYLIISGLFVMFRGKTLILIIKDFFQHPAVMYLAGILLSFIGLLLLLRNNIWDGTWRTVISIFGVLILAKGLLYIFFPKTFANFPYGRMSGMLKGIGLLMVVLGGYLWYIS